MNGNESMLPSVGPEAEESPLRLLEDILNKRLMQRSKGCTERIEDQILNIYGHRLKRCNGYYHRVSVSGCYL